MYDSLGDVKVIEEAIEKTKTISLDNDRKKGEGDECWMIGWLMDGWLDD